MSMELTHVPLLTFQKRMCLSAVPPPLTSRLGCHGHHASACAPKEKVMIAGRIDSVCTVSTLYAP